MAVPAVALRELTPSPDSPEAHGAHEAPVLVVGVAAGTDVAAAWGACAAGLAGRFRVLGWELGAGEGPQPAPADVADGVLAALDAAGHAGALHCAGDGSAGLVALHLALGAPTQVATVVLSGDASPLPPELRSALPDVRARVLALAGEDAEPATVNALRHVAGGVPHGRLVAVPGVVAALDAPQATADLVAEHVLAPAPQDRTVAQVRADGMRLRREVLGDAWVDAAAERVSEFTGEFQSLLTQWAWGTVWTRPGLDLRSRSLVTVTALVAGGHHEELAGHLRAARTNGLSWEELREALIQTAVYCSVPSANAAFRIAAGVYSDEMSE